MHRFFPACIETASAAVFLIPLFLYLYKTKFQSKKTTAAALIFALYLSAVYAIAGLPNVTYIRFSPHFNFIPFRYMFSDHTTSLLNVILFIPLGFFLPVLRMKFRSFCTTVFFGLCMSAFIEVFQIFTFRATDVNDLITNTAGTILGYAIGRLLLHLFPNAVLKEGTNELRTIFGCVLAVMFFVQPFLSAVVWSFIY